MVAESISYSLVGKKRKASAQNSVIFFFIYLTNSVDENRLDIPLLLRQYELQTRATGLSCIAFRLVQVFTVSYILHVM